MKIGPYTYEVDPKDVGFYRNTDTEAPSCLLYLTKVGTYWIATGVKAPLSGPLRDTPDTAVHARMVEELDKPGMATEALRRAYKLFSRDVPTYLTVLGHQFEACSFKTSPYDNGLTRYTCKDLGIALYAQLRDGAWYYGWTNAGEWTADPVEAVKTALRQMIAISDDQLEGVMEEALLKQDEIAELRAEAHDLAGKKQLYQSVLGLEPDSKFDENLPIRDDAPTELYALAWQDRVHPEGMGLEGPGGAMLSRSGIPAPQHPQLWTSLQEAKDAADRILVRQRVRILTYRLDR